MNIADIHRANLDAMKQGAAKAAPAVKQSKPVEKKPAKSGAK